MPVPGRQLDGLVDEMEQKANLHNGAIDHCQQRATNCGLERKDAFFGRSFPGERVFVDGRLLGVP